MSDTRAAISWMNEEALAAEKQVADNSWLRVWFDMIYYDILL